MKNNFEGSEIIKRPEFLVLKLIKNAASFLKHIIRTGLYVISQVRLGLFVSKKVLQLFKRIQNKNSSNI